ncbi:MAG: tRNA pseudouridine(55) synthase TruB [Pyrinomonadaceae bacterium]
MNGIVVIDKPTGITSHGVVSCMRRRLDTKKIGHTGTLDPFATGVLIALVGKATRLARFINSDSKTYEARIKFGFSTDTGDLTGSKTDEYKGSNRVHQNLAQVNWDKVFQAFIGNIEQIPPMYSAKKVNGKKLYELARIGKTVTRKPSNVLIHELKLVKETLFKSRNEDEISIFVKCSAGTYIRTLAEDIGKAIGIPCHLSALRRIAAGDFTLNDSVLLDNLESDKNWFLKHSVPMASALTRIPGKLLSESEVNEISHGRRIYNVEDVKDVEGEIKLLNSKGALVAIGEIADEGTSIKPKIVMV